jgi:cytochrome P450
MSRDGSVSERGGANLLQLDPPAHTQLRQIAMSVVLPRLRQLRPQVERTVGLLLDRVAKRGECDAIIDVAYPLTVTTVAQLLGLPTKDHDRLIDWATGALAAMDGQAGGAERTMRAMSYLDGQARRAMEHPGRTPDGVLRDLAVLASRGGLTGASLRGMVLLLFVAGHENSVNQIGNGLLALLRHPEQRQALAAAPELARRATAELLRFDAPVQITGRYAAQEVDFGGIPIPQGSSVAVVLGAANRDPAVYTDPDRLDLTRAVPRPELGFGDGAHECLGAQLARMEGDALFPSFAARMPDARLTSDSLTYRDTPILRALTGLPIAV